MQNFERIVPTVVFIVLLVATKIHKTINADFYENKPNFTSRIQNDDCFEYLKRIILVNTFP